MGAPTKLYWEDTEGGMGGAHDVLMANDAKYVGHFYVDADDSVDVEAVLLLIAAAPDLLESVRILLHHSCLQFPEDDLDYEKDIAFVRAAIAKAEGRPNA